MEKNVVFKKTTTSDLKKVAICHCEAFPKALATALGKNYVKHMLSWYLSSEITFMAHLEDSNGVVVGYYGGLIRKEGLSMGSSSGMAQHTYRQAIWAFISHPWVLVHPEVQKKWPLLKKNFLMRFKKRPKQKTTQTQLNNETSKVGLIVIGVNNEYHSRGYGSMLLQEFERYAINKIGISNLYLSVVPSNVKAIRAYEKNGWSINKKENTSIEMVKNIHK
jgi:ribosomal protein S18 acetylase RimI-like enzyme